MLQKNKSPENLFPDFIINECLIFGNENYFIKLIFVKPPSARISVPTINDDSSEAKNTAAFPISGRKPCLPIGVMSIHSFFT